MKLPKIALVWKVLIACILGICLGLFLPVPIVRIFTTFSAIFSQFIGFLVPLIILGLVTPAICRVGKKAGKMILATVLLAYFSTVLAGFFSYFTSAGLFPKIIGDSTTGVELASSVNVDPFFTMNIPPLMDVMTALVLAFLLGIMLTILERDYLRNVVYDFEAVTVMSIRKVFIPLMPLYIFCIFLKMSCTGEAVPVLKVFAVMILVIFAMSLVWLIVMFCVAGVISKKNPFKALRSMLPAYFTALGTSSSAATIPVTMTSAVNCGVRENIAAFTVPLCATIHMPGSIIKITACSITIMLMQGMSFDLAMFTGFITLLAITMVAAPGVPGGAIMAAIGVLSSVLGFGQVEQALIIALYVVMDCFGTACNVTGDGAISLIINTFFKDPNPAPTAAE